MVSAAGPVFTGVDGGVFGLDVKKEKSSARSFLMSPDASRCVSARTLKRTSSSVRGRDFVNRSK